MKTQTNKKTRAKRQKSRTVPVDEVLLSGLTDPKEAAAYVEACLREKMADRTPLLLKALMDVAKAHGLSHLSGGSESKRRGLYKALSPEGNPSLQTLETILEQLGLEITVRPARRAG